jgi:hypothetical protein
MQVISPKLGPSGWIVALALVVGAAAGCKKKNGDDSETQMPDGAQGAQGDAGGTAPTKPGLAAMTVDGTRCNIEQKQKDFQDLNQDGRADLITLYDADAGGQRITCKQADLNFDGRLDAFFHYNKGGDIEREQFDLDFDARIDMGRYYESGKLVRDEQDLNQDGAVDTWRYYDKGRLVRLEDDRDANGKADRFVYYVTGMIDRIGYDVNGNGKVDQWDHDAARRVRLAVQNRAAAKADEARRAKEDEEFVEVPQEGEEGEGEGEGAEGEEKSAEGDKAEGEKKKKGE